ncbi:type II toxin-antitoxin system RelE/ParE family toxin [Micromonospora sp. WMMA1363]|uniref:type II toxin-antitoxin system RelE family toxin n=1 Tax=Micromonospora sp. WMMA1363 TaxID=3053985 RepID=UPI00259C9DC8|nr:type II toxin-antitoxin system RelE/ParE family toxin [Micromonospora sp. WMMA1363]MDM4718958.1 type II toxin-antitoxin system RelE/ParE family toxin [Micromonospora sp. WMMA1363]
MLTSRWWRSHRPSAIDHIGEVGRPLDEPLDGFHSARRGTCRIIYRINEAKRVVEIHSIRHRRDSYRS